MTLSSREVKRLHRLLHTEPAHISPSALPLLLPTTAALQPAQRLPQTPSHAHRLRIQAAQPEAVALLHLGLLKQLLERRGTTRLGRNLTGSQLPTWLKQQVAGADVFDQQVGAELDASQVAVPPAQVQGEHIVQVKHQAGPACVGRGSSHQVCRQRTLTGTAEFVQSRRHEVGGTHTAQLCPICPIPTLLLHPHLHTQPVWGCAVLVWLQQWKCHGAQSPSGPQPPSSSESLCSIKKKPQTTPHLK